MEGIEGKIISRFISLGYGLILEIDVVHQHVPACSNRKAWLGLPTTLAGCGATDATQEQTQQA
jgi:hypothetical protein